MQTLIMDSIADLLADLDPAEAARFVRELGALVDAPRGPYPLKRATFMAALVKAWTDDPLADVWFEAAKVMADRVAFAELAHRLGR